MIKSTLITQKLDELVEFAKMEGEPNVAVVLLALSGSRLSNDDDLLANKVSEFVKDVLIPSVKSKQLVEIAAKN